MSFGDDLLISLLRLLGADVSGYIDLESADDLDEDNATLLTRAGAMVTFLAVDGFRFLGGEEEFSSLVRGMTERATSILSRPGHRINVYFGADTSTERLTAQLNEYVRPGRASAAVIGLDVEDLLASRTGKLADITHIEDVIVALWTLPEGLNRHEVKQHRQDTLTSIKAFPPPYMRDAQKLRFAVAELRRRHHAACQGLLETMGACNLIVRKMSAHHALAWLRAALCADTIHPQWRAQIPGDPIRARYTERQAKLSDNVDDISLVSYPPLADQLVLDEAQVVGESVLYNDTLFYPMQVSLPPQSATPFNRLFQELRHFHMPWRVMFTLDGAGLNAIRMKSMLASILAFVPPNNRRLHNAVTALRELENEGVKLCSLKINLCTWAPGKTTEAMNTLRARGANLRRAVEGWGVASVRPAKGDPFVGALCSLPGLRQQPTANVAVAPLLEATTMLPLFRPGKLWDTGCMLYRTPDGKPWPFQPGSELQHTWVSLFFAPPGSGKSVHLAAMNTSLCLGSGLTDLPYIHIIDIGPTSRWWIEFMAAQLPADKRHMAAYYRLRNQPEYAVNIFDTQLGYQQPLPSETSFLSNFLSLMLTLPGQSEPPDGVMAVMSAAIVDAYKKTSKEGRPKPYTAGSNRAVDKRLAAWGIRPEAEASWWDIVDTLIEKGDYHGAGLAQRSASPILSDIVASARAPGAQSLAGEARVANTSEPVLDYISRTISDLARKYPILAMPTQFDLGEARLVALDLDEVARGDGEEGIKQRSMMYMLARHTARHYYLNTDDLALAPPHVHDYHKARIQALRETNKHLCYDEFHRTGSEQARVGHSCAQIVRAQIKLDMREGRKWGVMVSLLSQSLQDFDETTIELASAIYVMGGGAGKAAQTIQATFGLSEAALGVLSHSLHGPSKDGAPFLGIFKTRRGEISQLLTLALGAYEIWAYSTTVEDVALRERVCADLGVIPGLLALAGRFPSGSAKRMVEQRRERLPATTQEDNLFDDMAAEICAQAQAQDDA